MALNQLNINILTSGVQTPDVCPDSGQIRNSAEDLGKNDIDKDYPPSTKTNTQCNKDITDNLHRFSLEFNN